MQIMRQVKIYCELLYHHKKESESDNRYPCLYMQIMRQVKIYCDLLYHHKKKVKVMTGILACTCRSWGHQAEPCGWIYARHVEREPWRIAFKQIQNWSKVNSEIHSREDFFDTKANQPCGYLSQRLSQTAASCSCSCSSDESSWLHFPRPLFSPLLSDNSHDNMSYLNFLPTLSQNFVNGLLVPTYICISCFHPLFKV